MEEVGICNRPLHPKKRKRNPSILLTTCAPFLGVECGQILLQLKRWCGNWVETVASPYWFDVFSKALVRHHACAVLRISINCHESVHFQDLKVFLEMWFKEPGAYDSARGFWIGRLPSAQGAQRFCGGRFYQEGSLIRCEEYLLSDVKEMNGTDDKCSLVRISWRWRVCCSPNLCGRLWFGEFAHRMTREGNRTIVHDMGVGIDCAPKRGRCKPLLIGNIIFHSIVNKFDI